MSYQTVNAMMGWLVALIASFGAFAYSWDDGRWQAWVWLLAMCGSAGNLIFCWLNR